MLGRWIRLIEAERALAAARFEEAIDLASHASVRAHRRAGEVREKAAAALRARARDRLDGGELSAAACDLRLADACAPASTEGSAVTRAVADALAVRDGRARIERESLAAADRAEKEGRFVEAREALRSIPDPSPLAQRRRTEVEARVAEAEGLADEAIRACGAGEIDAAEAAVARLRRFARRHPLLPSVERALETARRMPRLRAELDRANAGDATRAFAFLARHAVSHPDLLRTDEGAGIARAVVDARRGRVVEHLERREFHAAAAEARRLAAAAGASAERGLVEGASLAARGADAASRGEIGAARDAFLRARHVHPVVAAAVEASLGSLADVGGEGTPPLPPRLVEADLEARHRPWDAATIEEASRLALAEAARRRDDARVRAMVERLGRLRPVGRACRAFRDALAKGEFAEAARRLASAVDGLRRVEAFDAAEDLRLEGGDTLLAAMEDRLRGGGAGALAAALAESPVGELAAGLFEDRVLGLRDAVPSAPAPRVPGADAVREEFPRRFVLRIDDRGDALVLARDRVRVGHARESSNDLQLLARVGALHAEIRRTVSFHDGVVYEIEPAPGREVTRNGARVEGPARMADGDRIGLGERFAFEFRLPSERSRSAVLFLQEPEIGGARVVVLLKPGSDGRIAVGAGPGAHLAAGAGERVELHLDGAGRLHCASPGPFVVDGTPEASETTLCGGEQVAAGRLRVLVARS